MPGAGSPPRKRESRHDHLPRFARLFNAAATLVAAVIATFVMIRIAPGDPVLVLLGDLATPDQIAAARIQYGLDRPIYEQLLIYLGKAFTLDFGNSVIQGRPAIEIVAQRMMATLTLGAVTFALVIAVAVPSASRPHSGATVGSTAPPRTPRWWCSEFPISGWGWYSSSSSPAGSRSCRVQAGHHRASIVLPAVTLASAADRGKYAADAKRGDWRAESQHGEDPARQGIPTARIISHHVLRNALLPVLTVGGVQFGHLLGGAVIVETVFGWPGLGKELITAISYRDYAVVQACIFVMTFLVVAVNFAVDVGYRIVDPRLRRS